MYHPSSVVAPFVVRYSTQFPHDELESGPVIRDCAKTTIRDIYARREDINTLVKKLLGYSKEFNLVQDRHHQREEHTASGVVVFKDPE